VLTTIVTALRRPISARLAEQIHARVLVPARQHPVLLTQLVSLYADALAAFRAHCRTYATLVRPHLGLAFTLFSCSRCGFRPNPHVISAACARLPPVCGHQVHVCAAKFAPG
jgi:hypothetical protein